MKRTPKKHPSMVPSTGFTARLRDEEETPTPAKAIESIKKIETTVPQKPPIQSTPSGYTEQEIEHGASLAASIMAKRKMAKGGMVDLSINADEEPNNEDQMSFEALKKENYSETEGLDMLDQPEDSNLMGQEADDDHDRSLVDSIRRKMKTRSPITR